MLSSPVTLSHGGRCRTAAYSRMGTTHHSRAMERSSLHAVVTVLLLEQSTSFAENACIARISGGKMRKYGNCNQEATLTAITEDIRKRMMAEQKEALQCSIKVSTDQGKEPPTSLSDCYMGMKSKSIPDNAVTASSYYHHGLYSFQANQARLDNSNTPNSSGTWSAARHRIGEWIQVDFGSMKQIAGVITQGRPVSHDQWVTSFKITCGRDDQRMVAIYEDGREKIFQGNFDKDTKMKNRFPKIICCRYIRIYPQTWNNHISMRLEFVSADCFNKTELFTAPTSNSS